VFFGQVTSSIDLTPNGLFDNVFDQQGNQYRLSDLLINNESSTSKSLLANCSTTSYFNLYFEPGCGMDSTTDLDQIARRNVICKVFEDISNFINSPLTTTGNKVNIWVKSVNIAGVLGSASSFYDAPFTTSSIGGVLDGEIWKTMHTGYDSYTNVYSSTNTFYHGQIALNFTDPSIQWNTTLTANAPNNLYDLYTFALHEITHALGFVSFFNQNGDSISGSKYYSRYDTFLKNNSNVSLLTIGTCEMYDLNFNTSLNPTIFRPGCTLSNNENAGAPLNITNCNNAIKYVGLSTTVPVYTPTCYEKGSSFSHFEDMIFPTCLTSYGNDTYFVTSNVGLIGTTKRYLKPEERNALCDIGYSVNTVFGSTINLNYNNYSGTVCNGINVAGVNDGVNPDGTYTFEGTFSTPTIINNIPISAAIFLSNDVNATGFECLQDITASSILSITSGVNTSIVNFSSTIGGLHLLRYIPTKVIGTTTIRGNITYVYVYVRPPANINACTPTPLACDLVMNGNFEQFSNLTASPIINKACGWGSVFPLAGSATPTYCNSIANPTFFPWGVPCNTYGFQNCNNGLGNGYANSHNSTKIGGKQHLYTSLKTPLLPNTNYQLSFDISLADGESSWASKIQACLHNSTSTPPSILSVNNITADVNIPGNAIHLKNPTLSTNVLGWETINFNFTTTTGGEQFLYLGLLKDAVLVPNTVLPNVTSCTYSNNPGDAFQGNWISYYIDNVSLIPTNGASLNIPANVCQIIPDLKVYLSGVSTTGVFTGSGVIASTTIPIVYSFNPIGLLGNQTTITYNVLSGGCNIKLYKNVNNTLIPTFNSIPPICKNAIVPLLETTSLNGITGTWNPAIINNQVTTTYTFTPNSGQCATFTTLIIQIRQPSSPSFNFGNLVNISCGNIPILNNVSDNGVSGYWSPAIIAPNYPSTYTFITPCGNNFVLNTGLAPFPYLATSDYFTAQYYTNATTLLNSPGNYVNVLKNDTVNTLPSNPYLGYTVNLVGAMPIPSTGNITLNSNGTISLGANTAPGTYNFSYNFSNACTTSNIVNVTLVIKAMVIFAPGEASLGSYCFSNSSYNTTVSVLKNIKFNAMPATASGSIITLLSTMPAGIILNQPSGILTVPAGLQPGTYSFQYKVCSAVNPTNCSGNIVASITIKSTVYAYADTMIVRTNGDPTTAYPTQASVNILTNDIYGCNYQTAVSATLPSVTLTETTNPLNQYYGINSLGNVYKKPPLLSIVPVGYPSITLSYKICDPLFPLENCSFSNVFINVYPNSARGTNHSNQINKNDTLNKIIIQPNPSNGLFNIQFIKKYTIANVSVFNLIGQKIVELSIFDQKEYSLNLNSFSSGTYLMKIEINNEVFIEKLIKQ
jgi:hypothetical protein